MLAEDLKIIKDAELDIELLGRKNEKLCAENNSEITKLRNKIILTESIIEEELKKSGEDKLECKFGDYKGTIGWQKMPDKWIYGEEAIDEIKSIYPETVKRYIKTSETLIKTTIKEDILVGKMGLPSVKTEPQDKKFKYSIKKIKWGKYD